MTNLKKPDWDDAATLAGWLCRWELVRVPRAHIVHNPKKGYRAGFEMWRDTDGKGVNWQVCGEWEPDAVNAGAFLALLAEKGYDAAGEIKEAQG